jgi:hypothetical protein
MSDKIPSLDDIVEARRLMKELAQKEKDDFIKTSLSIASYLNNEELINEYVVLTHVTFGGGYQREIMVNIVREEILRRMKEHEVQPYSSDQVGPE